MDDDGRTPDKLTYEPSAQVCSRQGVEIYVRTDKPTDRHSDIHSDSLNLISRSFLAEIRISGCGFRRQ